MHFRWNGFNVFYAAGLILITGTFWIMIDKTPITISEKETGEPGEMKSRPADSPDSLEKEKAVEMPDKDPTPKYKPDGAEVQKPQSEIMKEVEPDSSEKENKKPDVISADSISGERLPEKQVASPKPREKSPPEKKKEDSLSFKKGYTGPPQAFYIPSAFEGCVPLQVQFNSSSPDAVKYEWNFGDGGSSGKKNPVYIFDEPGNYFVSLTVRNEKNEINSYSEIIKVYPNPVAIFEMDVNDIPEGGRAVYFYNYSRGAERYIWDFGDATGSELEEPTKLYENGNNYKIKLIAINENGCKDSMVLSNPFSSGEPEIIFPNAFTPNQEGPVGGYYSAHGTNNEVFHPFMQEQPVEYTLRIFNKNGNLIFESKDPEIGWDGYHMQELQPQGVYIYKLKAIFKNGQQIVKIGDVTLIHEERW